MISQPDPGTRCPSCGQPHEVYTAVRPGDVPDPGSVSVCFTCSAVAIFTEGGGLRLPTEEEISAILVDPEFLRAKDLIARLAAVHRSVRVSRW